MQIPYTTEVRPDTGLTNPKLGVWLFFASEVMLFGSLFSSYALLRAGAPSWPDQSSIVSVPLATLNTVVLIASSVTMVMAWASLKSHSLPKYRLYMGLTLLCGAIFLVVKTIEYGDKFSHHLYPATSNFLGLYFTMTGLHAIHVIAGMIVNAYSCFRARRCGRRIPSASPIGSKWPGSTGISWTWCGSSCFPFCICCEAMTHDVAKQVRGYLMVFGALLVLTLVTVGVSYLDLPEFETVIVALIIATTKASLVAMFFMHLKGERPMVTWPLALTAFLFVALLGSVLVSEADHLFGARFQDSFQSIRD